MNEKMLENIKIFSGSSHVALAEQIAKELGTTPREMVRTKFSCGEMYVKFGESVRGQDVFLVQTGRTGHMNDDLIELLLMIDAARQSFAKSITVIMPYMPYSRQDKIHDPREGISAKMIANMLVGAGASQIITVHLHADQIQGFFNCPVDNLNPRKLLANYFMQKNLQNLVVVSPDAGGAKDAKKFANMLGCGICILHKQRPGHNQSEVTHVVGDVAGKTAIIVDDMVDTAGSVCGAKEAILKAGANPDVYLCTTHGIFSGPAVERLNAANFKEILATDSLPLPEIKNLSTFSLAPLLAEVVKNVKSGRSVSQLYI